MVAPRMLSCAQLPLARTPTYWCSHAVASTEPIQPSRQSAVPAWSRWAAPHRPPDAPPPVTRAEPGRGARWGATAAGRRPHHAAGAVSLPLAVIQATQGQVPADAVPPDRVLVLYCA